MAASNTRQHRRIGVNVLVSHESVSSFRKDLTGNLSEGGIFIKTSRPLPVGTIVYMDVFLKDDRSQTVHAVGEVIWAREGDASESEAGMGITFLQIDEHDRCQLAQFIEKNNTVHKLPTLNDNSA